MTNLYVWLCLFALTFCYESTGASLSSVSTTVANNHDQINRTFKTSSVDVFITTPRPSTVFLATENTTDAIAAANVTVEVNSTKTLPYEDKLPSTTTMINDPEQLGPTTPGYYKSIGQMCANVSHLRVESKNGPKTKIMWDFEKNETSSVDLRIDAINSSSFNNENCSRSWSSKKSVTKHVVMLCPYQEYNISLSPKCASGPVNELSVLYKTEPEAPSSPRNLTIIPKDPSSLLLSWLPPKKPNGPLDGYVLNYSNGNTSYKELLNMTTKATHLVTGLDPGSSYNISLSAFNILSKRILKSPAVVRHVEMPEILGTPESLRVVQANSTSVAITWDPPKNTRGTIIKYSIKWIDEVEETNSSVGEYIISNLEPFTNYSIAVTAWMNSGEGPPSVLNLQTDVSAPSSPRNLTIIPKDASSSLLLSWLPPKKPNGPLDGYVLNYSNGNTSYTELLNMATHLVTGLDPGSSYNISLSAFNFLSKRILKSPAVVLHVEMPEIPGTPESLRVVQVNSTSVAITWDPPKNTRGAIIKYSIKWMDEVEDTNSSVGEYIISNLEPFTNYSIAVTAWMNGGEGLPSVLNVQTDVSEPTPPLNVTIQATSSWTLLASWDEPLLKNGPIHGYIIIRKSPDDFDDSTTVSRRTTNLFLTNLNPYTEYRIGISAYNINFKNESLTSQEVWCNASTLVYFPSKPMGFIVSEKHSYLMIKWSTPQVCNGPIDGYSISWWETNAIGNGSNSTVDIAEEQYYVNDLKPWTNYTVQVSAFNVGKMGENLVGPPSILHSRTLAKIPEPPTAVTVTALSPYSVLVEWSVGDDTPPGPTNYTIGVWEDPEKCTGKTRHFIRNYKGGLTSWKTNSSVIEDLKPHTVYLFLIVASTDAGSAFSNFSMATVTHSNVPGPPEDLKIDCSGSSTSVTLKWKSPKERNGDITEYRINYVSGTSQLPKFKVTTTEPESACEKIQHSTKIVNLRPEVNYRFGIQAKTLGVNRYGLWLNYSEKCILPAGIPPIPENSSNLEAQNLGQEEATLVWSQDVFSSKMGRVVSYSIIVAYPEYIGLPRNGSLSRAGQLPTWSEFWEQQSTSYQATPTHWNPFSENTYDPLNCQKSFNSSDKNLLCTIGWEKNCTLNANSYCNGRLKPGKQYGLKIRGFTRGGFSETHPLIIITAPADQQKSYIALPIGLVGAFIVFASAFGCYYILSRQKTTKGPIMNEIMVLFRKPSLRNTEPTVGATSAVTETTQNEAKPSRSMNFTTFLKHIKIMTSDSDLKFSLEYEELKENSPRHACTAAALEENRPKNRWMNIFPFDHSRVKLLPIDDEPGSDYINASYIPGFSSHREYIASQGPLHQTVDDFWRMVWEQKTSMIVMLTQCVERGKTKCEQYWPTEDEYVYHADLKVQKKSISILPEYTIRIFDLILGTRQRTVNQMHFTRWPDFGCPESPEELINFVKAVRAHLSHDNTGPILVHCSAGVGRTGTFIAVDRLSQYIQYHNLVDVYGTVMDMRDHRINMVQTENQYIYIHKCVKQLILEKLKLSSSNEKLTDGVCSSVDLKTPIQSV